GTYRPGVLVSPFFWVSLAALTTGATGIGLTIASLARTQRAASMASLSYLLVVALLLAVCQHNGIRGLPWLALEFHGPRLLHAAFSDAVDWYHWLHLLAATGLALGWVTAAGILFGR